MSEIAITDDKEKYRLNLQEYIVEPSYERLEKLYYFGYEHDLVIYDENGENTFDVEGEPIEPGPDEETDEMLEMYAHADPWYYGDYDVDETASPEGEECQEQEGQQDYGMTVSYWKFSFCERCLKRFFDFPSDETFNQYKTVRGLLKDLEQLQKILEECNKSCTVENIMLLIENNKKMAEKKQLFRIEAMKILTSIDAQ